jgi:hypothetical protein
VYITTYGESIPRSSPCRQISIIIRIRMFGDVIRSRSIRGVTSHLPFFTLVNSDIVYQHLRGEGELVKVDGLEIVGHSKVDNLDVVSIT